MRRGCWGREVSQAGVSVQPKVWRKKHKRRARRARERERARARACRSPPRNWQSAPSSGVLENVRVNARLWRFPGSKRKWLPSNTRRVAFEEDDATQEFGLGPSAPALPPANFGEPPQMPHGPRGPGAASGAPVGKAEEDLSTAEAGWALHGLRFRVFAALSTTAAARPRRPRGSGRRV